MVSIYSPSTVPNFYIIPMHSYINNIQKSSLKYGNIINFNSEAREILKITFTCPFFRLFWELSLIVEQRLVFLLFFFVFVLCGGGVLLVTLLPPYLCFARLPKRSNFYSVFIFILKFFHVTIKNIPSNSWNYKSPSHIFAIHDKHFVQWFF